MMKYRATKKDFVVPVIMAEQISENTIVSPPWRIFSHSHHVFSIEGDREKGVLVIKRRMNGESALEYPSITITGEIGDWMIFSGVDFLDFMNPREFDYYGFEVYHPNYVED